MSENGVPLVPPEVAAYAREQAWAAVTHPSAAELLARYYDPARNYAAATFLDLEPNDPAEVTATDLYALSLLDVRAGRTPDVGCSSLGRIATGSGPRWPTPRLALMSLWSPLTRRRSLRPECSTLQSATLSGYDHG